MGRYLNISGAAHRATCTRIWLPSLKCKLWSQTAILKQACHQTGLVLIVPHSFRDSNDVCTAQSKKWQLFDGNISWNFHTTFLRFYRSGRTDFTFPSLIFRDLLVDFFMSSPKVLKSRVSESFYLCGFNSFSSKIRKCMSVWREKTHK